MCDIIRDMFGLSGISRTGSSWPVFSRGDARPFMGGFGRGFHGSGRREVMVNRSSLDLQGTNGCRVGRRRGDAPTYLGMSHESGISVAYSAAAGAGCEVKVDVKNDRGEQKFLAKHGSHGPEKSWRFSDGVRCGMRRYERVRGDVSPLISHRIAHGRCNMWVRRDERVVGRSGDRGPRAEAVALGCMSRGVSIRSSTVVSHARSALVEGRL